MTSTRFVFMPALMLLSACATSPAPIDSRADAGFLDVPRRDEGVAPDVFDASNPSDAGPDAHDAGLDGDSGAHGLPATLSGAGLFASGVSGPLAPGVRSYEIRFPLWTDDAGKTRHVLLPEGESIDVGDADDWAFPVGTRIFKEFDVDGIPVETRLLWKRNEEEWLYVSYVYREDESDADAAPEGAMNVRGTEHDVPSQAQCMNCHRGGGDFVLGIGALQLERALFREWTAEGILPVGAAPAEVPGDATEQAALGYLHGNCAHCHNENHPVSRTRSLRLRLPVGLADAADAPAWQTSAGIEAFHEVGGSSVILTPGDARSSQLFLRMEVRSEVQMPPLGTERVDASGLEAVRAWIEGAPVQDP